MTSKKKDLCACGAVKYSVARQCVVCYKRGRVSERSSVCACGQRKKPESQRCQACHSAILNQRTKRSRVCMCGKTKHPYATVCHECYLSPEMATARTQALQQRRLNREFAVPPQCECTNHDKPSPWHCRCGRWKRSTERLCEVCFYGEPHITKIDPVAVASERLNGHAA